MEQQEKRRTTTQNPNVEQYKQQMLELGRRNGQQPPVAVQQRETQTIQNTVQNIQNIQNIQNTQAGVHTGQGERIGHRLEEAGAAAEHLLQKAEPLVERAEPLVGLALRSGLAAAGAAAAAEGIRLGVDAIEEHAEKKREAKQAEAKLVAAKQAAAIAAAKATAAATKQPAQWTATYVEQTVRQAAPQQVIVPQPQPAAQVEARPVPVYQTPAPLIYTAPAGQSVVPADLLAAAPPTPSFAQPLAPQPEESQATLAVQTKLCPVHGRQQRLAGRCRRCGFPVTYPACCCQTPCCTAPPEQPAAPEPPPSPPEPPILPEPPAPSGAAPSGAAAYAYEETAYIPSAQALTRPTPDTLAQYPYTAADGSVPAYVDPQAAPVALFPRSVENAPPDVAYDALDVGYDTYNNPAVNTEFVELPTERYASLDDFLEKNTGRGQLTVRIHNAIGGDPVAGANLMVTTTINGVQYIFYNVTTDQNGEAAHLNLPAPAKQLSFAPPRNATPYALYDITVTDAAGGSRVFRNVTIFADTESVQDVQIAPGNGTQVLDEALYLK